MSAQQSSMIRVSDEVETSTHDKPLETKVSMADRV